MLTENEFGIAQGMSLALGDMTAEAQAIINEKHDALVRALADVARLQAALVRERAVGAGLSAQVLAFKDAHPASPLLVKTGGKRLDGRPKIVAHGIYDAAFDKKARELGVVDPVKLRT